MTGLFPPDVTLHAFLFQALGPEHGCSAAVDRINADRVANGLSEAHPNTGNYTKARQRLVEPLVARLAKEAATKLEEGTLEIWRWKGRSVKMIDGTTVLMSDTAENQKEFPQHANQEQGSGFPIARLVALISLATGAVFDFAIAPYKGKETGELALARQLLSSLNAGEVLLADRYYCSYFFIALLQMAGVDLVSRLHGARDADFRTGTRLGRGDHLIEMQRPQRPSWMDKETYDQMPKTIVVREVKTRLDKQGFRSEDMTIVTTILDPKKHSKDDLAQLYNERWHVELDLRSIKTTMNLEMLRCKTPAMIKKELWVGILAYNLIRKIMAQAAQLHSVDPRKISFKGALQGFLEFQKKWTHNAAKNETLYLAMLRIISKKRVGNRPGRQEPRLVKRRSKPFKLLKGSRHNARRKLQRSSNA